MRASIVKHWTNDAIGLHFKAMKTKQKRPQFLNLLQIHLPVTGVNSIAHRLSGALLFLAIPVVIYLFNLSLRDAQSFSTLQTFTASLSFKIMLTAFIWAVGHHVLAGVRFLLADLDVATTLHASRALAWVVNLSGVVILIVAGYYIWV